MKVLITGGGGLIGSATSDACEDAGMRVVVLDRRERRVLRDRDRSTYVGDIGDVDLLDRMLDEHPDIDAVIHTAARSSVPGSSQDPLRCYDDNVASTVRLLRRLQRAGVARIVFSSSSAVYAAGGAGIVDEDAAVEWANPYAASKLMCERVIRDAAHAGAFRAICLRYANVLGAGPTPGSAGGPGGEGSVLAGLMSAAERGETFVIRGTRWATTDGSAVRDYIHVRDVAMANLAAVRRFDVVAVQGDPYRVINIGTGVGTTVRELISAYERVAGRRLRSSEAEPRLGDGGGSVMKVDRATELLGWRAASSIDDVIRDALERRASQRP